MMRKALLLVLFRELSIAAVLRPHKPEDVDNFNDLKSRMITEMLVKELSVRKCRIRFEGADLSELYFHLNATGITVHIENPRMRRPSCAAVSNISTDIFASRMDLSLTVPAVTVKGDVTFRQDTVRLGKYKEKYPFRLTLRNLTGSGLCFTRWTEIGYEMIECDMHYKKLPVRRLRLKINRDGLPISESVFISAFADRIWGGVTYAMNRNVADGINALLRDLNIMRFLRNPEVFQKYKNYVIESTESANDFVDGIMDAARKIINDKFHDSFAIPNIDESFRRQGILVVWQGSFKADHGTIHGLSTVSRIGDTAFATDNASQTHFFGNLSFEHLDLHYDKYVAEFMNFGPTGTLNTRLRPIRIHIHPYVNFDTGKIYLEEFEIGDVGELVVEVTGLGTILSWIISKITTWVVGLTRDKILSDLQRKYDSYIKSILSGHTIEDITGGNLFGDT